MTWGHVIAPVQPMDEMQVGHVFSCHDQLVEALQVCSTDKDKVEIAPPVLLAISRISAFIKPNKLIHSLYISPTPSTEHVRKENMQQEAIKDGVHF